MGSIRDFLILPTSDGETPSKSFAFVPEAERFVSSSLWDNSFHTFRIDSSSISHCDSVRQKFSLLSTLHYAGRSRLLAAWRDSSLTLWKLGETRVIEKPLYRATPHLTSIIDLDVSPTLRLIASLDKTRRCVFSNLDNGRFIRAFQIEGTDSLSTVVLFSCSFLAIIARLRGTEQASSSVRLYGIDTRKVGETVLVGEIVASGRTEFDFGMNVLMLGFRSGKFIVLRIPDLHVIVDLDCHAEIVFVRYLTHFNGFLVGVVGGAILFAHLE
jgi:hypothetical protein